MQESNNNPTGVTTSRDENLGSHRGRNFTIPQPIAEEEQQQTQVESSTEGTDNAESPATAFIDSVKKFFAPCVGAVDAASVYIGECRPGNLDSCEPMDDGENVAEDVIMRLRERNGGFSQQTIKRRSDTLEIPTHGMLFDDDDVSAISSHTLEEMERLRLAQNSRLSNFHMSPTTNYSNIMRPKPTDATVGQKAEAKSLVTEETTETANALAIAVSASDSSSSQGIEQRKEDKSLDQSAPPSWGSKAEEDQGFKTHPVA